MNLKEIGGRIRDLRLSSKTSKKALCEYLEISKLDLDNVETGNVSELNADIIEKLSNLYFCSTDYILNGDSFRGCKSEFSYLGFTKDELINMVAIHKIAKNQIEMDKLMMSSIG